MLNRAQFKLETDIALSSLLIELMIKDFIATFARLPTYIKLGEALCFRYNTAVVREFMNKMGMKDIPFVLDFSLEPFAIEFTDGRRSLIYPKTADSI
jgi:hypothetical protein